MSQFQPVLDKIIVEQVNKKDNQGLRIPDIAKSGLTVIGKVIAVGKGDFKEGKRIPVTVKEGDFILFKKEKAEEFRYENKDYYIIYEKDIFAILTNYKHE